MKLLYESDEDVFGMANLNPQKAGLSVSIWSQHDGVEYDKPDTIPRVKIYKDRNTNMSISIEEHPKILAQSSNIKQSDMKKFKEAIEYVGRNYDLFLAHYNDTTWEFDDDALLNALRERGEYK